MMNTFFDLYKNLKKHINIKHNLYKRFNYFKEGIYILVINSKFKSIIQYKQINRYAF